MKLDQHDGPNDRRNIVGFIRPDTGETAYLETVGADRVANAAWLVAHLKNNNIVVWLPDA